jgi:hypothetical protein
MVNWKRLWRHAGLTGVSLVALGVGPLVAQEKPAAQPADPSKVLKIEKSATDVVRRSSAPAAVQPPAPRYDGPKSAAIEPPTIAAVRASAAAGKFVNPKVLPGKVRWHNSFAAACAASAKSGKPVLLFQMMGKLDDEFC